MARVVGREGRYIVRGWSDKAFIVQNARKGSPVESIHPLAIMLHENEMQLWMKWPKRMDSFFEPDLTRPGKFKNKGARRT